MVELWGCKDKAVRKLELVSHSLYTNLFYRAGPKLTK